MKRMSVVVMAFVLCAGTVMGQTLSFLLRNAQIVPGPRFQYEVWIKSSDGTSRMGSILVYNDYNPLAFGVSVASNGNAVVTKNAAVFGSSYGQNPTNDNTASRFAYSWTYLGAAGSGVVIPSTGDGVLAFTIQITIANINQHAGLTFEQALMDGEQYKDDEVTPWPVVDASDFVDPPLPIQLVSFTGTPLADGHVRLAWATLSEINNYGFNVQRKGTVDSSFTDLAGAFVAGHGTTNTPQHYEFTDSTVPSGSWQYRLKQTDLDGTVHYTDPIAVNVLTGVGETAPLAYALLQNYPNPFNPATEVRFSVARTGRVMVDVYNVVGQRVCILFNGVAEAGRYHTVRFDGSNLASGVYFYRMQSDDFSALKKLLLLK